MYNQNFLCPYQHYYSHQAGSGIGVIYKGVPYQRGHGIGSFLGGLFRTVLPLLSSGARVVGKEALNAGVGLLSDLVSSRPMEESIKTRLKEVGTNLKRKADAKIDRINMSGSGYITKRKRRSAVISPTTSKVKASKPLNHSCECIKSELDLFALPSTQTSIESGIWIHYKPISSLADDGPIEFQVPGAGDDYIDLSHTMIHIKAKIINQDLSKLISSTMVAPVNNWMHSLFNQLDVYLNQKLVSPPNNTYAYRSYIETLLNYGPAAKESHLTCGLWYEDTCGKMNSTDNDNKGFVKRQAFVSESKEVEMIGHLHGDLFNQEKFLINGVEMSIKLVRSRETFNLMAASNDLKLKICITDASLIIRRARINPTVLLAHQKVLSTTTAKYPITRAEVKVLTIPAGVQGKSLDNIFLGQVPKRYIVGIVGFVNNTAFNGCLTKNPFNFENYDLSSFCLYVDGQQIPSKALQPSFENNIFTTAYHTLFSGTGIHFLNEGNGISRDQYSKGYCLLAFDLTADLSASSASHWNLIRNGSVRLEVRFESSLSETINCIVYAEFDNVIEIDKNRNVIVDYSS
ncbi:unnamed protein product [Leptosia nina]|uniref:Uncharacterized protein n=1 Tax=Leptosia nina TaxID=320188 RepID=A0AAV1JRS9_9NEOP